MGFMVVTVWTMAFLADTVVPRTVAGVPRVSSAAAVATDLALLLVFAVQHSVMARRRFKTWLRLRVPAPLERALYVLATDVVLAVLLVLWQPFGGQVWRVDGIFAVALWALYAGGWAWSIGATFAVDHLALVGLRQAGWGARSSSDAPEGLQVRGLHAIVRHPLMTGLIVCVWATPSMGASHLLYAAGASAYIAVGIRFEERDLRRTFGAAYDDYASLVGAVLPRLITRRS
ncbi:membrane protein [Phycicoccus endophyticus]|nr:membrane protein [Phycicoccus endophyticus]